MWLDGLNYKSFRTPRSIESYLEGDEKYLIQDIFDERYR